MRCRSTKRTLAIVLIPVAGVLVIAGTPWLVAWRRDRADARANELAVAIRAQDVAAVRRMLDAGYDPNLRYRLRGRTEPVFPPWPRILSMLHLRPMPPEPPPVTPAHLHLAADRTNPDIARLLLQHGANANALDPSGRTPLLRALAVARGRPRLGAFCMALLDYGAKPYARDADGRTPLHYATRARESALAIRLVRLGADPAAADRFGQPAAFGYDVAWPPELESVIRNAVRKTQPGGYVGPSLSPTSPWQGGRPTAAPPPAAPRR